MYVGVYDISIPISVAMAVSQYANGFCCIFILSLEARVKNITALKNTKTTNKRELVKISRDLSQLTFAGLFIDAIDEGSNALSQLPSMKGA